METILKDKRIAWVLEAIDAGSGGIQTICRHINYLNSLGAICSIHLPDLEHRFEKPLLETLRNSYECSLPSLHSWDELGPGIDIAIATLYKTAHTVANSECAHKIYFVQDFEPAFFPAGNEQLIAEESYRLGLTPVTIGNWLVHKLEKEHGVHSFRTEFGVDTNMYHPIDSAERQDMVCAIFQPEKPRRCDRLMLESFEIIHAVRPQTKLVVFGSDAALPAGYEYVTNLGLLSKEDCCHLYNLCSVGLSFGVTNPSRIPFEMMAAGLPVVELYGENNLYDYSDEMITLTKASPAAIASAALELLCDDALRDQRRTAGIAYCKTHPISIEQLQFADALDEVLENGGKSPTQPPTKSYTLPPFQANSEHTRIFREISRKGNAREKAAHKTGYLQNVGIAGDSFEIAIEGVLPNQDLSKPEVFVWCKADQSDIVRIPLTKGNDGRFCCIFTPDLATFEKSVYHFHAYAEIDGASQLIAIVDVLLFERSENAPSEEIQMRTLLEKLAESGTKTSEQSSASTMEIDIRATDKKASIAPAGPVENKPSSSNRIKRWIKRRKG